MNLQSAWVLVAALFASLANADEATRAYRIGNSLTWDSQPKAIEALAAQQGLKHLEAYHINCGKSLQRIWANPEEICVKAVEPFGTFGNALPNYDWDAVTFQPHPGVDSTLASDEARILDLIAKSQETGRNQKTHFFIYAPWPGQKLGVYHEVWMQETPNDDAAKTIQTRAYFEHLLARVRGKTTAEVRMIPAGHVVFELDERMRAGKIKGFAGAKDLFRDVVHLNNAGRFAAGLTTLATLTGKNPSEVACPPNHYGGGKDLTAELNAQIHDCIWTVVTRLSAATGVDADGDNP